MMGRSVTEDNPVVMGHEGSGIVQAVGPAVTTLRPGDRVAIEPQTPCRRCAQCKGGRYQLCGRMVFASDPPHHGLLAQVVRVPEDFAYTLGDATTLREGALVEPLAVAVHGVRLSGLTAGQAVLVLGSGTIGLLTAAVASAFGARSVCVVDVNEAKLEFARRFVAVGKGSCATYVPDLTVGPEDNAARIREAADLPDGADVVIECTGVESSMQTGLHAAGRGSSFVQVGMGKSTQAVPLSVMGEREIGFTASFRYGPGDYRTALDLVAAGKVDVGAMVSSVVPFDRATEAWEKTKRGEGIKNQIQVNEDLPK